MASESKDFPVQIHMECNGKVLISQFSAVPERGWHDELAALWEANRHTYFGVPTTENGKYPVTVTLVQQDDPQWIGAAEKPE